MRAGKSKKNQKEVLKIENTVTKEKNIFDGLMSRLDTADIRVSELEDRSLESVKYKWVKWARYKEKVCCPQFFLKYMGVPLSVSLIIQPLIE